MKSNFYFIVALLDCFLGFVYTLNGHWGWGLVMFGCGFIMANHIKPEEKN